MTSIAEVPQVVQITPPAESLLITHTQKHEAYSCQEDLCTFTTSSPSLLGLHKAQVHKIKTGAKKGVVHQYFCPAPGCYFNPQSGRFFKVLDHLKTHYMKVHFEKKFKCSKCKRAFGLERDCLRHEKVCGQTFTCSECGKEYKNKTALNMHCLSKGHRPPPWMQKASPTAKGDTKNTVKKVPLKDKKIAAATIPILPKFPLPWNMSILIPTQRMDPAHSLGEAVDAMEQASLIVHKKTNGVKENSKQAKNGTNISLTNSDLPQEMNGYGNGSADSSVQPHTTIYSSEGLQGNSCSQNFPINSTVSVIRVTSNSEPVKPKASVSKGSKLQSTKKSQKNTSDHFILPASVASLSGADQTSGPFLFQSHSSPYNNASNPQDCGKEQNIFFSSSSSTLPTPSQSEPLTKKLKSLARNPVTPISKIPAAINTHSSLPMHCLSSTEESHNSESTSTYISSNRGRISKVYAGDCSSIPQPMEQNITSSHLIPPRNIILKSEESNQILNSPADLSNLHLTYADTKSYPQNGLSPPKQDYTSLSSAETQTCVPYTTSDLVNDIETQTLESFLLDSLNSLLSDCETQTFESFLNDIETQTFESLPAISTLVNDNETQTNESSLGFCSLVNNSETQTLGNTETLYQLLNEHDTERNLLVCTLSDESGTQTSLKTTSDSVTQTLGTVKLDSIAQTSDEMYGSRENLYSLENTVNFPSADISCQVDTEDLFMNDTLTTLDIMTQTLDDYTLDSSNSEPLVISAQTLSVKEIGTQTIDTSGSSAPQCLIFTLPSGSQNIMTQTTNDLLDSSQSTDLDVPESSGLSKQMQFIDKLDTLVPAQNFASFDMPSSMFDSFDSWSNSLELPDSTAEAMKIFSSGKQRHGVIDSNTDAVTQTLCPNDCTYPALSIMDSITQTQEFSDSMTQTLKSSSSAGNVHSDTQTSLLMFDSTTQTQTFDATAQSSETFDSVTQTMSGCGTLTEITDELLCEGNVRQNMVFFNPLPQTASSFENMTQTTNSYENITLTVGRFDTTQTAKSSDSITQNASSIENMTEIVSSFDTMTQTVNNFDNMIQTANSFELCVPTSNYFDTMTQTADSSDNMTQTALVLDSAIQTSNSFDNMTQTTDSFETVTQTPNSHSTMTQTSVFDSFDLGCEMFTQTEEKIKSVWEMTTQTDGFLYQGSDIMTQTVDDGLWEMMTQTESDLMSDMMTQTGPNGLSEEMTTQTDNARGSNQMTQTVEGDLWEMMTQTESDLVSHMMTKTGSNGLWEEMTTQTDNALGSNQMTQTADKDLWEMMTQTEEELVSDMMTQTGESSDLWGFCSQDNFDLTCNIFTQTEEKGLWEMTTQTEAIMGSDMMTQTQDIGLWEMKTQTGETMNKDLWGITTQTDEIMECDMTTQTMENSFEEIKNQPEADLASDMMTQTAHNYF